MTEVPEFVPLSIEELQIHFPQYEILSFIAAGGMGAVYLANQNSIDRKVAIKVLPREMSSDVEFSTGFRAEAKVMSRMNHPNLVGFFDFGEVDGMLFIIMEFVDGKSLHHSAHGKVIVPSVALDLIIGITEGIGHAHEAGILHRDIKPANILLDPKATPKLGDFGLARPVEESELGKVIYGTPGYTAPEVVNNPAAIDERSDIYSLGVLLYELLVGALPAEPYIEPSKAQDVPEAFDRIIRLAIGKDPDLRYPDVNNLLDELKTLKLSIDNPTEGQGGTVAFNIPKPSPFGSKRPGAAKSRVVAAPVLVKATPSAPNPIKLAAATTAPRQSYESQAYKEARKQKSTYNALVKAVCTVATLMIITIMLIKYNGSRKKLRQGESPVNSTEQVKDAQVIYIAQETSTSLLAPLEAQLKAGEFSVLPKGTVSSGGVAYYLVEEALTWKKAQESAERNGGYLACPTTAALIGKLVRTMNLRGVEEAWTGGGTTGALDLAWINGESWQFPEFSTERYGMVALDNEEELRISNPSIAKPYFISWNLEGSQKGSTEDQINRVMKIAEGNEAPLPPNAYRSKNFIRYCNIEGCKWADARREAKAVGARLALPVSAGDDGILKKIARNVLPKKGAFWMGAEVSSDGDLSWRGRDEAPFDGWVERVNKEGIKYGVVMKGGEKSGWELIPINKAASGYILEWKIQESTGE